MRYNVGTNTWETVGSAGFSAGQVQYTSLALDSNDVPYVAYMDWGNSGKATVMWYNAGASAWQNVGVPGFSAGVIGYPQVRLDTTNRLYVSYSSKNNATVMRYPALPTTVTYTGIAAGPLYTFGTGCGGVLFTDIGSLEAITLTARFGYPTALGGGLPRRYDIITDGGGAYEAEVRLCCEDDDLALAGIPANREEDLHAYQFTGGGWVEHSNVDTVNNIVTADNITNLDQVWGLGIPENKPTALTLRGLAARGGLWGMGVMSVLAAGLVLFRRRKGA